MSTQILPENLSQQAFLAAEIIIVVVPALFVATRLINNLTVHRKLFIDDYIAVAAYCMLITTAVFYYTEITHLDSPTLTLKWLGNIIVASSFIAVFGIYMAKIPILIMYIRIFGVKQWLRHACYAVIAIDFVLALGPSLYLTVVCQPNNRVLDVAYEQNCVNKGLGVGVFTGSVALATDLVIFILPLPVVAGLQMPKARKLGVTLTFAVGFLGVVASSVTLYYRSTSLAAKGTSANEVAQMLGQTIELAVALIVGSVPALRTLWVSKVLESGFFSRLTSQFSSIRSKRSQNASLPSKEMPSGNSTENMVSHSTQRTYVELNDVEQQHGAKAWGPGSRF